MKELSSRTSIVLILIGGLGIAGALTALEFAFEPEFVAVSKLSINLLENLVLVSAMVVSAFVVMGVSSRVANLEEETDAIRRDLGHAREEGESWRRHSKLLLEGLSNAIQLQFDEWALTPAEVDIVRLMLKGLSTKEIASLRATTDATIRQQALGIYRKSGLANRAELSAFFLEDLLEDPKSTSAVSRRSLVEDVN